MNNTGEGIVSTVIYFMNQPLPRKELQNVLIFGEQMTAGLAFLQISTM